MNWKASTVKTKKILKNLALSRIIPVPSDISTRSNNKRIITIKYPTITISYKTVVLTTTKIITSILVALKVITIINQINFKAISIHKRHQF